MHYVQPRLSRHAPAVSGTFTKTLRHILLPGILSLAAVSAHAQPQDLQQLQQRVADIAKAGSAAAGYAAAAITIATDYGLEERFGKLGEEVLQLSHRWAGDPRLAGAPPATRRYIFFEYLTKNSEIKAAASNHERLLVNPEASVERIFEDPALIEQARANMQQQIDRPTYQQVGSYLLGTFPMIPEGRKAAKCKGCHASPEIGRPYPDAARILGYTFVALPIKQQLASND